MANFIIHLIKSTCQLIISLIISTFLIIPVFTIVFGFNEIRRILVTIYFKIRGDEMTKLACGSDGAYGYSSRAIIRILCVFHSKYNFESFKKSAIVRIIEAKDSDGNYEHQKFRSLFVTKARYSCWKFDENFDSNNHFRELPEELDMTEQRLMEIIQELDQPMPQNQPQWELIFIPRLPNNNECGVIFRLHHSYGDGLSIIAAFGEKLSPDKPFPYVLNPVTFNYPFWSKLSLRIKGYSYFGWTLLHSILNPTKLTDDRYPDTDEYLVHNTRFTTSLMKFKTIQKKTGRSTFSAILLTAVQNAIDRLHEKRLGLNCMVIVAKVPYPRGKLCNRITGLSVKVPLREEERCEWTCQLKQVNKDTHVCNNLTFFVNDTMNRLLGRMPASVMQAVQKKVKSLLVVSNLPFVTRSVFLGEGIMTNVFVWPAIRKSIFVSSLSIGDNISVTIGAGANILSVKELALLVEEIKCQLNIMDLTE